MQQFITSRNNLHLVTICDEEGVFEAFNLIKALLPVEAGSNISFVYAIADLNPRILFIRELSILEKRFPESFYVHKLNVDSIPYGISSIIQEFLEAIINTNFSLIIKFSIFGDESFSSHVLGILRFLNINSTDIQLFITEKKK